MLASDTDDSSTDHRQRVYEAFADRSLDPAEAVERALRVGIEHLGAEVGFLTRISDGTQRIAIVESADTSLPVRPGATCPLDRAYCRRTVESDGLLSVQDAATSPLVDDIAYETFGLGSYIGCKVLVGGDVYGTVCFASEAPRDHQFSEAEQLFVELLAQLSSQALERQAHEDRLRSETERVREEKHRLQRITETTFDIIYRIDLSTTFTYVSSAASHIVGYDPDDLLGESFAEYLTPESYADTMEAFGEVLDGKSVEGLELGFQHANGETVVLEINVRPVYGDGTGETVVDVADADDAEVVGMQGVARDITARYEREAEYRIGSRAIADANVAISIAAVTDAGFPIVFVNDAFTRLTGYDESSIEGDDWERLGGPDTEFDTALFTDRVLHGTSVTKELLAYRTDGTPFWTRATVTPVEDDDEAVTHLIGFMEDVTERKRTERLVELLNRVLRHNLRNDMNVLAGYAGILTEDAASTGSDSAADLGAIIERTASGLLELSESARELEEVARRERAPTRLDPRSLIERAVEPHRTTPAARIETTISTDRDVCAGPELELALSELVGNALRHDPDPPTHVTVSVADDGDAVVVMVADDGSGVPEMEADIVANGRETPLEHGSGLGLWLVNWVVTRYGGSFQIRPATPADGASGTVATLRLPGVTDDQSVDAVSRRPTTLFR